MKVIMVSMLVFLCVAAAAWGAEPCQAQRSEHERARARAAKALDDLENYERSPLEPLVPGQREKELQRYRDSYEAALEDFSRTSRALDECLKRKSCKKWKGGWHCTVAGTYEECCLDKNATP